MMEYHDTQWGVPVHCEKTHFEFLLLETMQAGLSWSIILGKREQFRMAFDNFDYHKISCYGQEKVQELLVNQGIIRNRRKIEAAVTNAGRFLEVQQEFGSFDAYIWGFTEGKTVDSCLEDEADTPTTNPLSDIISKDLKKRGFSFTGSTTMYAHLQAIGVMLDHVSSCFRYQELKEELSGSLIQRETAQRAWDNH